MASFEKAPLQSSNFFSWNPLESNSTKDLLPVILSLLVPEFDPEDLENLEANQFLCRHHGIICCLVSTTWLQVARKITPFWQYVLGNPRKPSGYSLIWSNRILHGSPIPAPSIIHKINFYWFQGSKGWKADRNKIFLGVFEPTDGTPEKIKSRFPLGDQLLFMDTDLSTEDPPLISTLQFAEPVKVQKGEHIGIIFEENGSCSLLDNTNSDKFPQLFFMSPYGGRGEEKKYPVLYDYDETEKKFCSEQSWHYGWCAFLTATH